MQLPGAIRNRRPAIARVLIFVFAFTAWSLTAPANIALALLVALFLLDVPGHWRELRREPAFLLLVGVAAVTTLLALRAALLFPATALDQWLGLSAWISPFLFFPVAWWVRLEPERVWDLLLAAALGLALGVVRKTDWSLMPQVLDGLRYDFGFAALGLAFIAAVLLVGLLLFRARILGLRVRERPRPMLGWAIWGLGLAFPFGLLLATQSRGAAMMLGAAGTLYALGQARGHRREAGPTPRQVRLAIASGVLLLFFAVVLLWSTKGRQMEDWQALTDTEAELSYTGSVAIRLNLLEVGLKTFAERPLLGFGPGTSTTEFLVPQQLVPVGAYHLAHVPAASHLHSVPLEILTRFGLVGVLIAALLLGVLLRAYRGLWQDPPLASDLRAFLTLGGVMTLLYCIYDFRIVNLDLRFFFILFFGLLYGLHLARAELAPPRIVQRHAAG